VAVQAEIGTPALNRTSTIFRAPLEFIKSDRPLLAQEKKDSKVKPLTPLADSAAADKAVIWQRVRTPLLCVGRCFTMTQQCGT
jgi:hypothetical protein